MSQEVLIYNPFSHFYFQLEVDLEIVNDHINRGDHVTFLTCDADLPSCEPNPSHNLDFCRNQCILNGRYQGFEVTGLFGKVDFRNFVLLSKSDRERIENFPKEVKTLKQLKSLMIDNFDVGMAVASSLIDFTKEPYPNPQHYQSYIRANIVAGLTVYLSMLNQIKILEPDILYVFNGRLASLRPAVRAAEMLSCPYIIHERAGVNGKYSLYYNNVPHTREYVKQLIESFWSSSSKTFTEEAKVTVASKWFIDRKNGREQGWYSYIKDRNDYPVLMNKNRTNIIIFNSSEHEFQAVSGWENPFYRSQMEGLYRLAKDLSDLDDIDIYLRVHPALSGINNSQTKAIQRLKGRYRNFHVIDADSSINSYLVLNEADLVITFGSTLGIEAVFWGKPSILLGRAIYEDLNAAYTPSSHAEVVSLIKSNSFACLFTDLGQRKLGALKYGFFMEEYGIPFKLFYQHDYLKLTHKESGIHIEKGMHWQMRGLFTQLSEIQKELSETQKELSETQKELSETQRELARIKMSKFWKMRNLWFKVKRKLGMR